MTIAQQTIEEQTKVFMDLFIDETALFTNAKRKGELEIAEKHFWRATTYRDYLVDILGVDLK